MFNGTSGREQIALFVDLENFIGFCKGFGLKMELEQAIRKLTEHGRVVIRRSFGDIYKLPMDYNTKEDIRLMLQNNLIQHEDVRHRTRYKNASDIKLIIEALSVAYSNPAINTFAVIADDRDYIPLFTKLREIGKTVIGIGSSKESTQKYCLGACDHFYYHDSLTRSRKRMPDDGLSEFNKAVNGRNKEAEEEMIALFIEATKAVEAKGQSPFGSNIAPMMRSLKSDLDFEDYGFSGLRAVASLARERGFVDISPQGGDISITCMDQEIERHFEIQENGLGDEAADDPLSLTEKYKSFVETKMKAILPVHALRETIYDAIVRELAEVNIGISLNNLSRNIAGNADLQEVAQPSIYKMLYGLFRNRTFVCLDSYNQYNPVIAALSIKREEMDSAFIKSVLTVFKRESRGIQFDSVAWSLYFYNDEDHVELIDDLHDQID